MTKSDKEKRRKHKRSKHGASPEYKLLTYCALGQYNKLRKLLQKHPTVDLEFFDPHGNTALHEVSLLEESSWFLRLLPTTSAGHFLQASRAGHHEIVIALLGCGT